MISRSLNNKKQSQYLKLDFLTPHLVLFYISRVLELLNALSQHPVKNM